MISKEKIKGIIIGAVGATVLTTTVFAAPVAKNVQLFFNNIKIYVDDSAVTPKDAQGNTVEPFVYNGTTYLPVRAVSNALGKNVEWDGKTSSVYIGKHNNSSNSQPSSMWLDQLDYFNFQKDYYSDGWSGWDSSKDKDSAGNSYTHGIKYTLTAL
ncbi:MAG: copper amine oxidase N-terminal domain-containing protein, partial [Bacillota bacterium]|nr:copper amine oxidase N-terminal domain-containing protein [Bacillota bacterium]